MNRKRDWEMAHYIIIHSFIHWLIRGFRKYYLYTHCTHVEVALLPVFGQQPGRHCALSRAFYGAHRMNGLHCAAAVAIKVVVAESLVHTKGRFVCMPPENGLLIWSKCCITRLLQMCRVTTLKFFCVSCFYLKMERVNTPIIEIYRNYMIDCELLSAHQFPMLETNDVSEVMFFLRTRRCKPKWKLKNVRIKREPRISILNLSFNM